MESHHQRINKFLEDIKENKNYKKLDFPPYIYDDQEEVLIGKKIIAQKTKITYMLDCDIGKHATLTNKEYIKSLSNKTLVISPNIHYLIIKEFSRLNMYLNLSKAVDLEYLEITESRKLYSYGYNFNFNEIKAWPPNLKYLILSNYNYPLVGLPASLIYLEVPTNYDYPLENLPAGLISIKFSKKCKLNSLNLLPLGLKSIEFCNWFSFDGELDNLPPGLETLIMQTNVENLCNLCALPYGLRFLILRNWTFEYSLENIPSSLEYLEIPIYTTNKVIKYFETIEFPTTLKKLCLLTCSSYPHEDEIHGGDDDDDDNGNNSSDSDNSNSSYENTYYEKIEKIQSRRDKVIRTLQQKYPELIITTKQGGL